jgi:ABC-2 type transport system ATP-binding protein
MKIITGFMAPSQGNASVAGFDVFESPLEVKKRIGYLPETPPVYGDMYVRDYLRYVAELKQTPKDKIENLVKAAIEKTNLGDVQKRLIHGLSKGFKQRVGIAQAIVSDPEVLILDEPTVGLDPKQVAEIRELIKSLKGHHTIVLSTHILPEVEATCDKVIIINKGEIVVEDSIHNLQNMEKGQSRLKIRVRKDVQDMKSLMTDVRSVVGVHAGASRKEWSLDVQGGDEAFDEISAKIVQQGYGLVELSPSKTDLEDVFLKMTYDNQKGNEA